MSDSDITAERLREVLHYDPETGVFTWLLTLNGRAKAGEQAGSTYGLGYRAIGIDGRQYQEHRLAWLYMQGEWPPEDTDHRNRVRSDNRWVNLRLASRSQNRQNSGLGRNNTSGVKGVVWYERPQKWGACIQVQNSRVHLGLFHDINDAIAARKAAEAQLHPFAAK